ncbi:MAG: PKD domain-containing protein [Microbacterium sp.]|nr:PKD domain-containing protein [Microbacterium sp.]
MSTSSTNIRSARRRRSSVALVVGVALASAALVVPGAAQAAVPSGKAPLLERTADVVTADPLPTVQIDSGYVWAQATIGRTVYAGGSFSNARAPLAAPGTSLTPRSNLLAFDVDSGGLLPFAPVVNGAIKAIAPSPDGSRLYIGGTFTTVNGVGRSNFAILDAKTGAVIPGLAPAVGGSGVYAITATADTVYIGGLFTQVNGTARKNLAALSAADGRLLTWAPTADLQVDALVLEPGAKHVVAGGRFYRVNNVVQQGLVALSPTTGGIDTTWAAPKTVKNGGPAGTSYAGRSGIFSLSTDDKTVYGTGWVYSGGTRAGNLEGAFAAEAGSGAIRWVEDCHGDSYGIYATGKTVYTTSHIHSCETVNLWPNQTPGAYRYMSAFSATAEGTLSRSESADGLNYADWSGTPSPSAYGFFPDFTSGTASGLGQAGLSITGVGDVISVAGEFTSVNNKQFQGIVRFATKPVGGAKQGPRLSGATWAAPTASAGSGGRVSVTIPTNWDRDNRDLTYQLMREGTAEPVDEIVATSLWWAAKNVTLTDTSAPAGTAVYTVRAVDPDGNTAVSRAVSVRTAGVPGATASDYANAVLRDGAEFYYPLGDIRTDWVGGKAPIFGTGVTSVKPGAVAGDTGTSTSNVSGTTSGYVSRPVAVAGDDDFSTEAWIKTTTTWGGQIYGFGTTPTGTSTFNDRVVYMQNSGRLSFGSYASGMKTITSPLAYNDGQWHHVVSTLSREGMVLYVDGKAVARNTAVTTAWPFNGYWRAGYDILSGLPGQPTSSAFSGKIDEFAGYGSALTAQQVAAHYALGRGQKAPTASFTATVSDLSASVDAGASTAEAGQSITGYSWTFGDGSTGSGVTASHVYAAAGTYTVTLTVTDGRGLSATTTKKVTVAAANAAPVAAFTVSADGMTASVDGSASADPDGRIASYMWSWGDGLSLGSGATASHPYPGPGTYTVTLTVTDDRGATGTATREVVIAGQAPSDDAVAKDVFARTASSGWGSADVGGAWTVSGGGASAASVSGGVGALALGPGGTRNLTLNAVSAKDVTLSMDFSMDAASSTGAAYAGLIARSTGADNYVVRAWLHANGSVWIVIQRGATVLSSSQVPGITRAPGDAFSLKVDVSGGASTTISAKLWRQGSPEPAGWQTSFVDAAGIDAAGAVGVHASRAASATTTGTVTVDNFRVLSKG